MSVGSLLFRAWARRDVFIELSKREVAGRYSGSYFGVLWSFFNPLLMLAVYTLAFRKFLGMRWPGQESTSDFALMIFAGMIVHALLAECLMRSPTVIVSNANLVKRVVFPLAVLPCVSVASAVFHAVLSLMVLLLFAFVNRGQLSWTVLYLPLVFAPYVLLLCGLSWLMASLGVFVRDVVQLSAVLASIFMFLSPVFYPASSLQEPYRAVIDYNPLTLIIEQTRQLVLFGQSPDWIALVRYSMVAILVALLGYAWFQRTREGFADVL